MAVSSMTVPMLQHQGPSGKLLRPEATFVAITISGVAEASGHVSVLDVFGRVVDKEDPELRGSIRGTGVLE